jgi:hypothetical protein
MLYFLTFLKDRHGFSAKKIKFLKYGITNNVQYIISTTRQTLERVQCLVKLLQIKQTIKY